MDWVCGCFRFLLPFAAMLSFLFAGSAAAFGDEGRTMTLREALQLSLEGNPELRAMAKGLLASKEDIGITGSFLLPKLAVEERFMRTNNPTYAFMAKLNQGRFEAEDFAIDSLNSPDAINDFQTSFSIEQALFAPKASIRKDMTKNEFAAREIDMERKKEEVVFRVFSTYIAAQTAREFMKAAEKGAEDSREHLRIAKARYDSSLGLYSDTLRAEVAVLSAEERLVSAKKNFEVARRAIGLMLGMDGPVTPDEGRPAFELRPIDHYQQELTGRKDLRSLEQRYRNSSNLLSLANAGYMPVIGFGGAYQLNDHRRPFSSEGDSWQMSAFLRWELFDGARREHEREKAKLKISETEEYLIGLKREISFRVHEAYLGVLEARQGVELAHAALRSAEEGRRLVMARYENSLSPMVDLLDVQAGLDGARAKVAEREGAYLTAMASLFFQSGTILRDLGLEK